jgi:eukaryotic-like serine/threonine-protein kinase
VARHNNADQISMRPRKIERGALGANRGSIRRFFNIALGALGLVAVALISAFIAMRLAIHGREAMVPAITGLTIAEASSAAGKEGLSLTVENRFYSSNVPGGHVIAQDPPAGFHVRRDWPVRITESLGSQRVSIPNLVGQSERAAMISVRQLGLEPGTVVHMAAPGDPDIVIAQMPAPAGEVSSPRISLLVSDGDTADVPAYVMPSLVGLSYSAAASRAASVGLHLFAAEEIVAPPGPVSPSVPIPTPGANAQAEQPTVPVSAPTSPPTSGTVVAQTPPPGRRIQQGDSVHITVTNAAAAQ